MPTASLPNRPLNILAIDGGAMMGVVPSRIMQYLEGPNVTTVNYNGNNPSGNTPPALPTVSGLNSLNQQLYQMFDVVIGTSTGGLISLALTVPPSVAQVPMTAAAILNFYYQQGPNIFPQTSTPIYLTPAPLFNNNGLINAITGVYGCPTGSGATPYIQASANNPPAPANTSTPAQTIADGLKPALVTTYNYNLSQPYNTGNPVVTSIDNTTPGGPILVGPGTNDRLGNKVSVIEGCLLTSAFPMLLPPVPYDLQFQTDAGAAPATINYFLDGGIFAGSPALAAYLWAMANNLQIGTLVSIGCGRNAIPTDVPNTYNPVAGWGAGTSELNPLSKNPKPGWLVSQPMADGFFSAVLDAMQSGPGIFTDQMLETILASQYINSGKTLTSKFVRLDPQLSGGAIPAYNSDKSDLDTWVQATDTWVGLNVSEMNAVITQVEAVSNLPVSS